MVDEKLLKYNINNTTQLEEALKIVWTEISKDVIRKLFQSMPTRLRQVISRKGYACCYWVLCLLNKNIQKKINK